MPRRVVLDPRNARPAHLVWPTLIALVISLAVVAALRVEFAAAQTFTPGSQARVSADGDALRLRAGATVDAAIVASIPDRSVVDVRDGSATADGYTWQFVEWNGAIGWVAAEFLEPIGTTGTETPSPTGTASPTPPPTGTSTPPPSGAPLGTITGALPPTGAAGLIVWGGGSMDSLVATAGQDGCNVRSVYTVRDGRFIAYTPDAPAFVNASWVANVGNLTGVSALLVFCDPPVETEDEAAPED